LRGPRGRADVVADSVRSQAMKLDASARAPACGASTAK
jgi:hypothetical protein